MAVLNRLLLKDHSLSGRLYRWSIALSPFDYTTEHVRGVANPVADSLSRRTYEKTPELDPDDILAEETIAKISEPESTTKTKIAKISTESTLQISEPENCTESDEFADDEGIEIQFVYDPEESSEKVINKTYVEISDEQAISFLDDAMTTLNQAAEKTHNNEQQLETLLKELLTGNSSVNGSLAVNGLVDSISVLLEADINDPVKSAAPDKSTAPGDEFIKRCNQRAISASAAEPLLKSTKLTADINVLSEQEADGSQNDEIAVQVGGLENLVSLQDSCSEIGPIKRFLTENVLPNDEKMLRFLAHASKFYYVKDNIL